MSERPGRRDRYVIGEEIAAGGMATVHLGALVGDMGFARTVAIKRLHPQFARDPDFREMLLDEGRLAARIAHVHVVATLDVVATGADLFMVMEYVHGEPLNRLLRAVVRRGERIPARIAAGIVAGALRGLHAAHEARDAHGRLLGVVHRDVSPQNVMVGADGVARVLDFGIAKAAGRSHATVAGQIKGKFAYMPPEQLKAEELDRRADVYAAGVVLWETLVGARLFAGADHAPNLARLIDPRVDPPSARASEIGPAYDAVTLCALAGDREARFRTALAMAEALEAAGPVASPAEIGAWVRATAGDALAERAQRIAAAEKELAQRIRDSFDKLDTIEDTVTDVADLALPPLPAAWMPPPAASPDPAAVADPLPDPASVEDLPPDPPRRVDRPEARRVNGLVASAVALLTLGGVFLLVRSRPVEAVTPPAASAAVAADSASAAAAVSADPPPSPSGAERPKSTEPQPSSSAPPAPAPPPPTARPSPPRAADTGCSPPYTIDVYGHKHYKRACLR